MGELTNSVEGFILAGGGSKRLGRDKRNLLVNDESLLLRTVRIVSESTGDKPTVVGDNLGEFDLGDVDILPDAQAGKGPLGGLVSALSCCRAEWALIVAVDMPHLSSATLRKLIASRDASYDIITLSDSDLLQPLAALYHIRTKLFWEDRLERDQLSLIEGIRERSHHVVAIETDDRSLVNINYPEDLNELDS